MSSAARFQDMQGSKARSDARRKKEEKEESEAPQELQKKVASLQAELAKMRHDLQSHAAAYGGMQAVVQDVKTKVENMVLKRQTVWDPRNNDTTKRVESEVMMMSLRMKSLMSL